MGCVARLRPGASALSIAPLLRWAAMVLVVIFSLPPSTGFSVSLCLNMLGEGPQYAGFSLSRRPGPNVLRIPPPNACFCAVDSSSAPLACHSTGHLLFASIRWLLRPPVAWPKWAVWPASDRVLLRPRQRCPQSLRWTGPSSSPCRHLLTGACFSGLVHSAMCVVPSAPPATAILATPLLTSA